MSWTSGSGAAPPSASVVKGKVFLGRGTYGVVYRATWKNQTVAVKDMEYSEEQRNAFENEITLLEKVKHPNVIKLLAHCITDMSCSLIMEFAECGNLYDLLHSSKAEYGVDHALVWCHQTAQALAYLHNMKPRPLVHRDVKPPNLLH